MSGCLVYHCTHEYLDFGECLTMLYVSKYEEEWNMDRELLKNSNNAEGFVQYAYVANLSDPICSEHGTVAVSNVSGGLIRVA